MRLNIKIEFWFLCFISYVAKGRKMKLKKSTIIVIIILVAYTILSFYKLGRNENPQTFVNLKDKEQLIYKLPENCVPDSLMLYTGNDLPYVSIFLATDYLDTSTYVYDRYFTSDYVFQWNKININQNEKVYSCLLYTSKNFKMPRLF